MYTDPTEDLIDRYEAKRDDFAKWLAGFNPDRLPSEGVVSCNLFLIGDLVGFVSQLDEESYAEEATGAILDAYPDVACRDVDRVQYFRDLIDELFDRHIAPLYRAAFPDEYGLGGSEDSAGLYKGRGLLIGEGL